MGAGFSALFAFHMFVFMLPAFLLTIAAYLLADLGVVFGIDRI